VNIIDIFSIEVINLNKLKGMINNEKRINKYTKLL
jgi:hypothetical protein